MQRVLQRLHGSYFRDSHNVRELEKKKKKKRTVEASTNTRTNGEKKKVEFVVRVYTSTCTRDTQNHGGKKSQLVEVLRSKPSVLGQAIRLVGLLSEPPTLGIFRGQKGHHRRSTIEVEKKALYKNECKL